MGRDTGNSLPPPPYFILFYFISPNFILFYLIYFFSFGFAPEWWALGVVDGALDFSSEGNLVPRPRVSSLFFPSHGVRDRGTGRRETLGTRLN